MRRAAVQHSTAAMRSLVGQRPFRFIRSCDVHLEQLARLGYVARGSVFLIIGFFCAYAAYASTRPLDSNDAFRNLLNKPLGGILLGAIAAGLFCFAAWRLAQALLDVDHCGKNL